MNPVARAIDGCRDLTSRMLEAAERGDWEAVARLDGDRRPCFDGVDVAELEPDALEAALGGFRALMAMDGRLRDLAAAARRDALGEVRRIRKRQHGTSRYHELSVRG